MRKVCAAAVMPNLNYFSENDPSNPDYCRREVFLGARVSLRPAGDGAEVDAGAGADTGSPD